MIEAKGYRPGREDSRNPVVLEPHPTDFGDAQKMINALNDLPEQHRDLGLALWKNHVTAEALGQGPLIQRTNQTLLSFASRLHIAGISFPLDLGLLHHP